MYNGPKRDYENYPVVAISDGTPRRLGIVPHFMLEPIVAITGMSGKHMFRTVCRPLMSKCNNNKCVCGSIKTLHS